MNDQLALEEAVCLGVGGADGPDGRLSDLVLAGEHHVDDLLERFRFVRVNRLEFSR